MLFRNRLSVGLVCIAATWFAGQRTALADASCSSAKDGPSVSATGVSFGIYLATQTSFSNGTVTVACGDNRSLPSFTISLSPGNGGGFNPRRMISGTYRLNYNLYTNAADTIVWGDGTGGSVSQSYNGGANLTHVSFTAYGKLPASQYVAASHYLDTIVVTVTY